MYKVFYFGNGHTDFDNDPEVAKLVSEIQDTDEYTYIVELVSSVLEVFVEDDNARPHPEYPELRIVSNANDVEVGFALVIDKEGRNITDVVLLSDGEEFAYIEPSEVDGIGKDKDIIFEICEALDVPIG